MVTDILPAPTNVQLRRVSSTAIEISWDSPRYPGVSGYRVYYRPTSQYGVLPLPGAGAEGPAKEQGIEVTVDTALDGSWLNKEIGPYTSTELSGLEPGVIYAVKVRAKTADGRLGNLSEAVWTRRRDSGSWITELR
jgi:Fibronectin type III domain